MSDFVLVGAGNIGSHLLPHLARLPGAATITVIDPDVYSPANLSCQQIFTADIGKPKAHVQAQRVWQIHPGLVERAYQRPVEALPLGWLHADAIVAAVDSRYARLVINRAAFQLGVPWIDAGILADGHLVRVNLYVPGPDAPCLECAWDGRDYDLVEQAYPCATAAAAPPTGARSSLGALAAALEAHALETLLGGSREHLAGKQLVVDARHHRTIVTTLRRNPSCRMPDHEPWRIEPLTLDPAAATLDDLRASIDRAVAGGGATTLGVANQLLATSHTCRACASESSLLEVVRGREMTLRGRCACGAVRALAGRDLRERVSWIDLDPLSRNRSLSAIGLLAGDVLIAGTAGGDRHLELVDSRGATPPPWPVTSTGALPAGAGAWS